MTRSDLERLRDARDHAHAAREIGRGFSAAVLEADSARLHALFFRIVVVGETLGRVDEAVKMLEPGIPWRDITDTRNQLVHAYWQVDLSVIVELIDRDLIPLTAALDRLVAILERDTP